MATNYNFTDYGAMRPTARTWIKHTLLLVVTFCTATIAGSLFPFGNLTPAFLNAAPETWGQTLEFIATLPIQYLGFLSAAVGELLTNRNYLIDGLSFSLSLLFILLSHEMGHYVACRLYRVDATLPYFIPTPPMIGPAGTFGAFIKIMSPLPSRRATFDIGVAGPIAGFIAMIPIAVIGVATMKPVPANFVAQPGSLIFSDPPLLKLIGAAFGTNPEFGFGNPYYYAAWVGCLVTALNLIPSGQLDGGHAIYAVLGKVVHHWTGRAAFVAMAILSVIGWFVYGSPSGFLIAILLGVMLRIKHPEPYDQTPLDTKRLAIALATLLIFIFCFTPFPIRFT
ncbi:MAG TPA: site-2 protease family protein [Pyrinomonadaceae bacterium]|jgi:membrane-associated protease RseP (regulator of RpoE activity)|nr:site-2 protease family protein [Pyrinomonadaceae bacterium]